MRVGARQIRDDHHAERLGREDEHEVDAVGGQEAVRLSGSAELVREQRARTGRRECDDDLGETGEETAAYGAPSAPDARRGRFHGSDQSRLVQRLTIS